MSTYLLKFQIRPIELLLKYFFIKISEATNSKDSLQFQDSLKTWREQQNFWKNRLNQVNFNLANAKIQSQQKDSLHHLLDLRKKALMDTEYKISQLMIPKISQQNFMFWASIAFVILMCILLGTFFYVVSRDTITRQAIFGSDSGIQFIALFSIIIAVILFGLTGVLEGKELSALLGSIAGYILGKVKLSADK